MTPVAATTRRGLPSGPNTWSPTRRAPIVVQPEGVGIGVEIESALPSSRAETSSGRETTS